VFASCGNDRLINIFDSRSQEPCVLVMPDMHTLCINSLVWHPLNYFSLITSSFDNKINMYDLRNPEEPIYSLSKHSSKQRADSIIHPIFAREGQCIVTLSGSRIFFYNSATGEVGKHVELGFAGTVVQEHYHSRQMAVAHPMKITLMEPCL